MDLLDEPGTLVLLGIIFLFGGLGVLKLLRPAADGGQDESAEEDNRTSSPTDADNPNKS